MYAKEMVKQSLPLLIICGLGGIVTGNTLGAMVIILQRIPGLIVVIPAVIALRGNISTALGSRLGSAYHLGLIDETNLWTGDLKQNIIGSIILSFIMSFIIGVLAYGTSLLFGVQPDIILLNLTLSGNDSYQIIKKIKQDEDCASIPILVIKTNGNLNSKIRLLKLDGVEFVNKPFQKA